MSGKTLTSRLRQFFAANPDEELTYDDVMVKFNVSRRCAYVAAARMEDRGELTRVHVLRAAKPAEEKRADAC